MKIVAFSDIHGQISKDLTQWFKDNPGDILLFAGDIQSNHFDDGSKFLAWMNGLPYKYKIMIFGNHDGNYDYMLDEVKKYPNMKFLMNEMVEVEGIKIFGSPNSLPFLNWYHMKTEEELAEIYSHIPEDVDILMTHCPSLGILDETTDGRYVGSKSLRNAFKRLKNVKLHVCGHIHESRGIEQPTEELLVINASVLDDKYRLVNNPWIISLENNESFII